MFSRSIQLFAPFLLLLAGCRIQEAPKSAAREVTIVSDYLTKDDSVLIRSFGKDEKIRTKIVILTPDSIRALVGRNIYNTGIDVLLTQEKSLRDFFYSKAAFAKIDNPRLFQQVERQFDNTHNFWIGLSHDPLVIAAPKDTLRQCPDIDPAGRHRKDSLGIPVKVKSGRQEYMDLLSRSSKLQFLTKKPAKGYGKEIVMPFSELVELENSADSAYNHNIRPCFSWLAENKRYFTRVTTVSLVRYSRNAAAAKKLVNYLFANSWSVANGRNQLPTVKRYKPNWYIESLLIR
jgi:hypothetical protein